MSKSLRKLAVIIIFLNCCNICQSQNFNQIVSIDSSLNSLQIDSLRHLYGYNKNIPDEYELSILLALSYFPELDSTKIIFKKSKIKTTLNARPTVFSLIFRKKSKKNYIVRINKKTKDSIVLLSKVPFNARIGLFGHEFSHFICYREKTIFGIINRLASYMNKKTKEHFEKEIDLMTIQRGLGFQLYSWSFYVLYESDAKEKYKEFKRNIYLEPDEILDKVYFLKYTEN